jgi:hypothetical protein
MPVSARAEPLPYPSERCGCPCIVPVSVRAGPRVYQSERCDCAWIVSVLASTLGRSIHGRRYNCPADYCGAWLTTTRQASQDTPTSMALSCLSHATVTCRLRVVAEGLQRLLPSRRRFALVEPHTMMLCVLVAVCRACPVVATFIRTLCLGELFGCHYSIDLEVRARTLQTSL